MSFRDSYAGATWTNSLSSIEETKSLGDWAEGLVLLAQQLLEHLIVLDNAMPSIQEALIARPSLLKEISCPLMVALLSEALPTHLSSLRSLVANNIIPALQHTHLLFGSPYGRQHEIRDELILLLSLLTLLQDALLYLNQLGDVVQHGTQAKWVELFNQRITPLTQRIDSQAHLHPGLDEAATCLAFSSYYATQLENWVMGALKQASIHKYSEEFLSFLEKYSEHQASNSAQTRWEHGTTLCLNESSTLLNKRLNQGLKHLYKYPEHHYVIECVGYSLPELRNTIKKMTTYMSELKSIGRSLLLSELGSNIYRVAQFSSTTQESFNACAEKLHHYERLQAESTYCFKTYLQKYSTHLEIILFIHSLFEYYPKLQLGLPRWETPYSLIQLIDTQLKQVQYTDTLENYLSLVLSEPSTESLKVISLLTRSLLDTHAYDANPTLIEGLRFSIETYVHRSQHFQRAPIARPRSQDAAIQQAISPPAYPWDDAFFSSPDALVETPLESSITSMPPLASEEIPPSSPKLTVSITAFEKQWSSLISLLASLKPSHSNQTSEADNMPRSLVSHLVGQSLSLGLKPRCSQATRRLIEASAATQPSLYEVSCTSPTGQHYSLNQVCQCIIDTGCIPSKTLAIEFSIKDPSLLHLDSNHPAHLSAQLSQCLSLGLAVNISPQALAKIDALAAQGVPLVLQGHSIRDCTQQFNHAVALGFMPFIGAQTQSKLHLGRLGLTSPAPLVKISLKRQQPILELIKNLVKQGYIPTDIKTEHKRALALLQPSEKHITLQTGSGYLCYGQYIACVELGLRPHLSMQSALALEHYLNSHERELTLPCYGSGFFGRQWIHSPLLGVLDFMQAGIRLSDINNATRKRINYEVQNCMSNLKAYHLTSPQAGPKVIISITELKSCARITSCLRQWISLELPYQWLDATPQTRELVKQWAQGAPMHTISRSLTIDNDNPSQALGLAKKLQDFGYTIAFTPLTWAMLEQALHEEAQLGSPFPDCFQEQLRIIQERQFLATDTEVDIEEMLVEPS